MRTLEELKPGTLLGRYSCLMPIAKGGMAAVWTARMSGARAFEKIVAIKTILPTLTDDPNFERMFLDEARLASRIRHPNVVEIHDLGEQENILFIVMEYIDGEPLSAVLREAFRKDGIPLPIAARIIIDACMGLHAAHELKDDEGNSLGVVHRDVSPQNILVSYDGIVKLTDFGIVKALGRGTDTTAGTLKGKPAYMAPEQVAGGPLTRTADVFAMGVILFQLTTGKHPFRGDNEYATLGNLLNRSIPPPSGLASGAYPAELDVIVKRALARDPLARYPTALDLAKALENVFVKDRATSEDVGTFVRGVIGHLGKERREALKRALTQPVAMSAVQKDAPTLTGVGADSREGASAKEGASEGEWVAREASSPSTVSGEILRDANIADAIERQARAGRAWKTAAAAAGVALVALAIGYASLHRTTSPPLSASSASSASPIASTAEAAPLFTTSASSTLLAAPPPTSSATTPPTASPESSASSAAHHIHPSASTAPAAHASSTASSAPHAPANPTNQKWAVPVTNPGF